MSSSNLSQGKFAFMRYSFPKGNLSLLNSFSFAKTSNLATQFNDTFLFPIIFILFFLHPALSWRLNLFHIKSVEEYLLSWMVKRVSSPTTNISINSDLPFTGKPLTTCYMITEGEIIALVKAAKAKVFCDVPLKKLHIKWTQQILRTACIFSSDSIPFWTFT